MTSRRAKRKFNARRKNALADAYHAEVMRQKSNPRHSSSNSNVVHGEVAYWPKYFFLYEHSRKHTVIRVPSAQDMLEIQEMMRKGKAMCTHSDELGECIHIEKATFDEWLAAHPGES